MVGICPLSNPIREYAWGSRRAIAELLGAPVPSPGPQAELWLGAHPADPSRARWQERWVPLPELLAADAVGFLGAEIAERFDGQLPFLLKVLAAEQPLSIQAHPDSSQARAGFARENDRGIPIDASERSYRDPYPKPELICALTPFSALRGFRTPAAIAAGFAALGVDEFATETRALTSAGEAAGLEHFLGALLGADRDRIARAVDQAATRARHDSPGSADSAISAAHWVALLAARYPNDAGALAPLFLNVVRLAPGEAMYLGAGELHLYLEGVGIEVMANSDNVLRGGLTSKHIDVPELLSVLRFAAREPQILRPRRSLTGEHVFDTPADEFQLAVLTLEAGNPWRSGTGRGIEIWLLVEGHVQVTDLACGQTLTLERGGSFVVPDSVERYELTGAGVAYRAGVPHR